MNILIVSATAFEISEFCNRISDGEFSADKQYQFFKLRNHSINILITGPGMHLTSYKLSSLLTTQIFDFCIQAGICGAFDIQLQIGEVVQVRTEKFAQLGAEDGEKFLDVFELNLLDKNEFPFTNGCLINNSELKYAVLHNLKPVDAITVETVHGNDASINKIISRLNPAIESMEGAPFFYACLMHKIPFMELRAISNYVEKRNKENWNISLAVEQLNKILISIIEEVAL